MNELESPKEVFKNIKSYKELKKWDSIAKLGEMPSDVYVLKSGIIRSFFTDEKVMIHNTEDSYKIQLPILETI